MRPGDVIGDVDGEGPGLDGRDDVRLDRIAGHDRLVGARAVAGKDAVIGAPILLRDDLHGREQIAEAGRRQLALLVQQVALGDQHKAILFGQAVQSLVDARQGLDRMGDHLAAGGEDFAQDARRRLTLAQLHRRLDHGQGEALDAVAVEPQVPALHLGQARLDERVVVVAQQIEEPRLGQAEDGLVVPEGVVGIEPDCGDGHGRADINFADS